MHALTRITALTTIIIALLAVTLSQTLGQASQSKEPSCSISGRVTIGDVPARGVTVLLVSAEPGPNERPLAKATTDQDGRFHLTGAPPGQHLLQAFAPALVAPNDNMMGRSGKVINLTAGESAEGIDIALIRGGVITGRVSDADGQPLIQETVRLFLVQEQGRKVPFYLSNGSYAPSATDDRGVYRLFGVPPGRYIVSVGLDPSGTPPRDNPGNTYYPVTYHPDATDETKATVIEVAAGSEATGVDIVLGHASKAYSASGRIIDADTRKPMVAMRYGYGSVDRRQGSASYGLTSGARGEFRIDGLAPGGYFAFAAPDSDSEVYSDPASFTVKDSDVTGIEIKLHRGSSIIGNVIIEGAESQPGAPRISDLRLGVSSGRASVVPRFNPLSLAPDGSFRATGLPEGVVNFSIYSYPAIKGLALVRVERDGIEQKNGVEVGLTEEISGVKVVFAYGTGSICGQVQVEGGEIPAGAMMYLSLRRIGAVQDQGRRPSPPDSRGRFAVDGLLPGEYELSLTFQARQMTARVVKQTVAVTNGLETKVTLSVDLNEKNQ